MTFQRQQLIVVHETAYQSLLVKTNMVMVKQSESRYSYDPECTGKRSRFVSIHSITCLLRSSGSLLYFVTSAVEHADMQSLLSGVFTDCLWLR